jgi:uncharacterized protein YbaR (Trm112 family)
LNSIPPELLSILRCPLDGSPLAVASAEQLARLNQAIAEGRVRDRADRKVERTIEAGLVRADGLLLYPIEEGIVRLLADGAIPVPQA